MDAKRKILFVSIIVAAATQLSVMASTPRPAEGGVLDDAQQGASPMPTGNPKLSSEPVLVAVGNNCKEQVKACSSVERGNVISCMADFYNGNNAPSWCFAEASDSLYQACQDIDTTRYCTTSSTSNVNSISLPSTTTMAGYLGTTGSGGEGSLVTIECSTSLGRVEQITVTWGKGSTDAAKPARILSVGIHCSDGTRRYTSKEDGGGRTALNGDTSDITYSRTQTFSCDTGQLFAQILGTTYGSGINNNAIKSLGGGCRKVDPTVTTWPGASKSRQYGIDTNGSNTAGLGGAAMSHDCTSGKFVKGLVFFQKVIANFDDHSDTRHSVLLGVRTICASNS